MSTTRQHLTRTIAILVCAAVINAGCATSTAGGVRIADGMQQSAATRAAVAEYVQQLKPGLAVRVGKTDGRTVRGTLMNAMADTLVLQPRARVPEPPIEIPLADIVSVTPESTSNGASLGKAIGIGVAAGAGAVLGIFLILAAVYSD
jgi:hypothetical protein